jgi:hypothetical protein
MFNVKNATTFSEEFYRAEDCCARGYDGPQLRHGSADSEVLNCRCQAIALIDPFSNAMASRLPTLCYDRYTAVRLDKRSTDRLRRDTGVP